MNQHQEEPEKESSERWLLTYSDLITLLLIFFIIMYAMSNINQDKFKKMMGSFQSVFSGSEVIGVLPEVGGNSVISNSEVTLSEENALVQERVEQKKMQEVQDAIKKIISSENLSGEIDVSLQERGLMVSMNSHILFESGQAILTYDSTNLLERVAAILSILQGQQIRVEGHTDDDPIYSVNFPSNWELSAARANTVFKVLLDKGHLDPQKTSAAFYGEFRSKVPNNSPENKAKNRRVDIVILKNIFDKIDPVANNIEK